MAVVDAPLFSLKASGNICKTLVYTSNKKSNIVKGNRLRLNNDNTFDIKDYKSQTQEQEGIRGLFCKAVKNYLALSPAEKETYNLKALKYHISGMNQFIKEYINNYYDAAEELRKWVMAVGSGNVSEIFNSCNMRLAGLVLLSR